MDYILQSTIEEIANSMENQGYAFGIDAVNKAKYLVEYCPKKMYLNIDEMTNHCRLSSIEYDVLVDDKIEKITASDLLNAYCSQVSVIEVLMAICKELKGENGLMLLHMSVQ